MINLCINEFIKIFKKKSTLIFIILIVLSLLVCIFYESYYQEYSLRKELGASNKKISQNDFLKQSIEGLNQEIANMSVENQDKKMLNQKKAYLYYTQYALDNNICIYSFKGIGTSSQDYWKRDIIKKLIKLQTTLYNLQDVNTSEIESISKVNKSINDLKGMLDNDDYNKYIDFKKNEYKQAYEQNHINEETKEVYLYMFELDRKYGMTKYFVDDNVWRYCIREQILKDKSQLIGNKSLSYEENKELNDDISIELYCIENNISMNKSYLINYNDYYIELCENVSLTILGLYVIIIASGIVSKEFAKGTIKQLFITPNKRWKIIASKIITLTLILIISSVILSLIVQIIGNIVYSSIPESPYVYILNRNIKTLNPVLYNIFRFLIDDIRIFVYMLFAIMLSTSTKNTAISTGISVLIYIGENSLMQIINKLTDKEWIKFIPFNNFDISNRIFNYSSGMIRDLYKTGNLIVGNISLEFSFCVIFICILLIIITTFSNFNKKTI